MKPRGPEVPPYPFLTPARRSKPVTAIHRTDDGGKCMGPGTGQTMHLSWGLAGWPDVGSALGHGMHKPLLPQLVDCTPYCASRQLELLDELTLGRDALTVLVPARLDPFAQDSRQLPIRRDRPGRIDLVHMIEPS